MEAPLWTNFGATVDHVTNVADRSRELAGETTPATPGYRVKPVETAPADGSVLDRITTSDLLVRSQSAYQNVVSDPKKHGPGITELVDCARARGAWEPLILLLRAQAWAHRAQFALGEAKTALDEAAQLARKHRLPERLAEVLVTRAAVHTELGQIQSAQRDLAAAQNLMPSTSTAELVQQQAALHQNLGQLTSAASLYERILIEQLGPVHVRAIAANNLAIIECQIGRPDLALSHIEQASQLAAESGPALVAGCAATKGWITMQTGKLTESLRLFDQAADLYTAAGLPLGEHYLEYVDALIELRLLPEANLISRRALAELERGGVHLMAAEAQYRTAVLALLTGEPAIAVEAATAAFRRFSLQRRAAWAARSATVLVEARTQLGILGVAELTQVKKAATTLEKLGLTTLAVDAHLAAGRAAIALQRAPTLHLNRALQLAAGAPVFVRMKGHVAKALLHQHSSAGPPTSGKITEKGSTSSADRAILTSCRAGLTDLAQHRASLASIELRVRASAHGAELGRIGLEVLLRSGTPGQVFAWMERTRAAALVAVGTAVDPGVDEQLAALRSVQADLAAVRSTTGHHGPGPADLLAREAVLEQQIRRSTWGQTATQPHRSPLLTTAQVRRQLAGEVLIEYGTLGGALFAVVLEPRRTRVVPLGQLCDVKKLVGQLLFALQMLLQSNISAARAGVARARADHTVQNLSAMLLGQLDLSPEVPVVVVPTGAMQRLPWSALRETTVTVAPSAASWAGTRTAVAPTSQNVALIAGPDLPGAITEVLALAQLYPGARTLIPPASTVDEVLQVLAKADFAHLACHLHLRSDNPSFSALQLSDGSLTMHELEIRGIAPHRMVLAACNSAADTSYAGNEVLGFVSALLSRGTNALVASIVVVPDAAAIPVMRELHVEATRGKSLGSALFSARQTLDRLDPNDFVNWCAFNSYGAA